MKKFILFATLVFLGSCATIQPEKPNTMNKEKISEPHSTESVASIDFKKIINLFVNEIVAEWEKIHPSTHLRIVMHELDTNTDEIFSSEIKTLVEESLAARSEISILERSEIDKIFIEQYFEDNYFFSMADMKPLKLAEADAVLYGLLHDSGAQSASLKLSCAEYETARVLVHRNFEVPRDYKAYVDYSERSNVPLPAPKALKAEDAITAVALSWPAVKNYDAVYEVLRSDSYDVESLYSVIARIEQPSNRIAPGTIVRYTDENLSPSKKYFYRLRYMSRGKISLLSESVHAQPYEPAPEIQDLKGAWNLDAGAALVTWTVTDAEVSSFEYEITSGATITKGTTKQAALIIKDHEPDKELSVSVRAITKRGVKGKISDPIFIPVPPERITGLIAMQNGKSITLNWEYPETGLQPRFRVYSAISPFNEFDFSGEIEETSFKFFGFTTGYPVRFKVAAINQADIEGPQSEIVELKTFTDPGVPTLITATSAGGFIILEWQSSYFYDFKGHKLRFIKASGKAETLKEGFFERFVYKTEKPGTYIFEIVCLNKNDVEGSPLVVEVEVQGN
jgi:ferritin-like protein